MNIMRKNVYILVFLGVMVLTSCEKWKVDLPTPGVSFTISPENPKVGDMVTVQISTNAEYLSIYTGDSGHDFNRSKVKVEMEHGSMTFYDEVYRPKLSKDPCVWRRDMKDYASLEQLKQDFEFFGAVENIQLGVFDKPAWSMVENSSKHQLKFTIADRNVVSGFTIKPNIHLYNWDMFFEMRLVPCAADSTARFVGRSNKTIHSLYNVTIKNVNDGSEVVSSGDFWNGSGPFCWDYFFYVYQTGEPILPPWGDGSKHEFYSLRDRIQSQNRPSYREPDNHVASELKVGFGWPRQPWENGPDWELNGNHFPASLSNYAGFQGDVYITSIQWGQEVYAPYDQGVSLGSVYTGIGLTTTYEYTYTEQGDFEIVVVATNVGRKNYTDGYEEERGSYDNEYDKKRNTASKHISVKN